MGEVWAGERLSDGREVALKVLLADMANTGEVIARFRREAQVLARVRSKYVAQVLDFLTDDDFGFVLVMDLIPGDSLHAVLSYDKKLTIETTLDIVSDVLRGLRDLHNANIVHRDLKPGNIVLRPRPGLRPRATLIDFGVSRIISDPEEEEITAITRGDRVLGTLEYMAPEQILGSRTVTGTADLYAVGAMMYRAIAGHHAFRDLTEGHLAVAKLNEDAPPLATGRDDEISDRLRVMVSRLLSRRLRDRFKTAEEALAEVEAVRALVPGRVPEESHAQEEERTLDRPMKLATVPVDVAILEPEGSLRDSRAAVPIAVPEPPPDTPMSASMPRHAPEPPAQPWRTLVVAAGLFIAGSVGGGMFGVSFARGGLAFDLVQSVRGRVASATAVPSASVPVPVPVAEPDAPAPVASSEPAPPVEALNDAAAVDAGGGAEMLPDADDPIIGTADLPPATPSPPTKAAPRPAPPKPVPSPQPKPPSTTPPQPVPAATTAPKPAPKPPKPAVTTDTPKPVDPPKEPQPLLPDMP